MSVSNSNDTPNSNAATATTTVPSNEQLSKQMIDCAILIKKGEYNPALMDQCIQSLIEYATTAAAGAKRPPTVPQQPATVAKKHNAFAKIGKMMGQVHHPSTDTAATRSDASKRATSQKNASRLLNELDGSTRGSKGGWFSGIAGGNNHQKDWCDEHFCMNCGCKYGRPPTEAQTIAARQQHQAEVASATSSANSSTQPRVLNKPPFHRPNPALNSTLLANGWIEQHRRSKLRSVWKQVLVSIVEGRQPGQETTLWIQREVNNSATGRPELEALHQIPVRLIERVSYWQSTDPEHEQQQSQQQQRFAIQVHQVAEEFVFRCPEDAVQMWIVTLRSVVEAVRHGKPLQPPAVQHSASTDSGDVTVPVSNQKVRMAISELRAIAHGAGHTTVGMERADLERLVTQITRGPQAPQPQAPQPQPEQRPTPVAEEEEQPKQSIKELRAIAEANGVQTAGMERSELEAVVAKYSGRSNSTPPVVVTDNDEQTPVKRSIKELRAIAEAHGVETAGMERGELEAVADKYGAEDSSAHTPSSEKKKKKKKKIVNGEEVEETEEERQARKAKKKKKKDAEKRRLAEEAERNAFEQSQQERDIEAAAAARDRELEEKRYEEEKARKAEDERQRKIHEEQLRQDEAKRQQKLAADRARQDEQDRAKKAEEERRQKQEEERRKVEAERLQKQQEEERRKQEEAMRAQQQQWQQQQQQWQQHQAAEAARRSQAEAAYRQQQASQQQQQYAQQRPPQAQAQWQQQQQQQQWQQRQHWQQGQQPHMPQQQQQQQQGHQPYPQQQQQWNHQQQQAAGARYAPNAGAHTTPPQQQATSPSKWGQMAKANEAPNSTQNIKHSLLVQWALQPPTLQVLRPVEHLLTSIHAVFPPKFGVAPHAYFSKWTALTQADIWTPPNPQPDNEKLKKTMRKLRFFLHPDKLPKDFSSDQTFVCKLLWDISNDAWEEHKSKQEDLDWIQS